MARLDEQLKALATLSPALLRREWQRVCKSVPPDAGPTFLRLGISHRLQARREADLDMTSLREIARLSRALERDGSLNAEPMGTIKPGTRLVREWHGTVHQVLILDKSYIYRDRTYTSLTRVAREITGTHCSGPQFFGLRKRGKERSPGFAGAPAPGVANGSAPRDAAHG